MNNEFTKKQVATRWVISLVIGVLCTALYVGIVLYVGGGVPFFLVIVMPVLFTWSASTIVFDPKGYLFECGIPFCLMFVYLFTLRFGKMAQCIGQFFRWIFRTLVYTIKLLFWLFSKEEL